MDPGDLEPPEWLQVPTGSKRPSPSPSEGEEHREIKKSRTQASNFGNIERQNNELVFPFTECPSESFLGTQSDSAWTNQDAHGVRSSTITGLDTGFEVSTTPFIGGNINYGTNFGNELPNTAVHRDLVAGDGTYRDDFVFQNPDQESVSFIDDHPFPETDCVEHSGRFTAADLDFQDQFPHAWVNEAEVANANQDLTPEFGVLSRVEPVPIRRAQMDGTPSHRPATSTPKESTDVPMDCDACFGVVGYIS